jgi:hypothetical protein
MFRQNLFLMTGTLLLATGIASTAGATAEENCQARRMVAAGRYEACQQNALANFTAPGDFDKLYNALANCRQAYVAKWANFQTLFRSTSCAAPRLVDNGDGTVADNLTGLQWEQKDDRDRVLNPADPHDADNVYSFSATGTAGDGSVYTSFVAKLNGSCFAHQCDWRLPTLMELLTILDPTEGKCGGDKGPCIDRIFGPTHAALYWSTTPVAGNPDLLWLVLFRGGGVVSGDKNSNVYARAVRGGL